MLKEYWYTNKENIIVRGTDNEMQSKNIYKQLIEKDLR